MKEHPLLFAFVLLVTLNSFAQRQSGYYEMGDVLYEESFDGDLANWSFEMETPSQSAIQIIDEQLDFSSFGGGTTVWFRQKLEGSIMIEYNATAMPIGGVTDSVSDVNSFWMMTDLAHPDDILADSSNRGGSFTNYHKLPGYYVGKGAGRNQRTTFKKHHMRGNGTRIDWGILTDKYYLLKPSFPHKVQLVYYDEPDSGLVQYICDDSLYFEKWDPKPCRSGWFAFRGYNTHVRYDNFKVYRLLPKTTNVNQLDKPEFRVFNNYPNPFNPVTNITFSLLNRDFVKLFILNSQGQIVDILESGLLERGNYLYHWDASQQASGVYFSRLQSSTSLQTGKMLLVR